MNNQRPAHHPRSMRLIMLLLAALLAACASDRDAAAPTQPSQSAVESNGLQLSPGFHAEVYARGLRAPTALAWGPDGRLYLTQLSGRENGGAGQIVALTGARAEPAVLLDGLFKPTGLAWRERDLFVTAGRDVLRTQLDDQGQLSPPETLVRDLPYNTRSEGQIALLPDGRLLFESSGELRDRESGRLLTLAPGGQSTTLATGLKNAYAATIDPHTGRLFVTEIGDDPVDGAAPPDEINLIEPGADYGWPRCYGAQLAARNHGGDLQQCARTRPPIVELPPHSTPTGLVFYDGADFPPDYRGALYVALWNGAPPRVLRVTLTERGGRLVGQAAPFIDGLARPIALLPDPAGGLLVLDHEAGVIYRVLSDASAATP